MSHPEPPFRYLHYLSIVALLTVAMMTGCKSAPLQATGPIEPANLAALVATSQAINANDLEQARVLQQQALEQATNEREQQNAIDLGLLIEGAMALHAADIQAAQDAWSKITDPVLAAEVRERANHIGVLVKNPNITNGTDTQIAEAE